MADRLAVPDEARCCALVSDHEGCCAWRCDSCDGSGRCADCGGLDDMGCDWCDGTGSCLECFGGEGWFSDDGPCMAPPRWERACPSSGDRHAFSGGVCVCGCPEPVRETA